MMSPRTGSTGASVSFITLGCAKNEVDSEHMAEKLASAGYAICDDVESADVVVVNTCSFIQAATEESIEAVLDAAGLPRVKSGEAKLVVAGCMPARYGDDLRQEVPEASDFVDCADEEDIVARIDRLFGIERLIGDDAVVAADILQPGSVFAYVKISDGCDRHCAYCTIPSIRGRYRSFTYERIEGSVARNVAAGTREIVLIAQDTGRWGADFDDRKTLGWLVSRLAERFPDTWFRVMYIQPEGVTDELIEAVASHDNICSYFDIPFQHCDADVLRSMNRRGDAESFLALVGKIRDAIPDVTLRTTLIAGYPGETEEQFESLCDFICDACLDYVGVFPYSREEGTKAYSLDGQVDEDEKRYRAQRVRDVADDVSSGVVSSRVGRTEPVLVCGEEEDGQLFGRTRGQAPDVDGVTYIDKGAIGHIVTARIEGTLLYEMEGTVEP